MAACELAGSRIWGVMRNDFGMAFPILALFGDLGVYWLFVIGFVIGAYATSITKYTIGLTALFGLLEWALERYFIWLQAGIVAGLLARGV